MQFIDLNRQYDRVGDKIQKRMQRVIESKQFIMGPEIGELEKMLAEFAGTKYAITCASGTDALVLPLMAYDIKENDAVFVSSFTFFASGESISFVGGTPVFVDSDETFNMDTKKLELAIEKTIAEGKLTPRGIIAVDIFGLPADYDEITRIAKKYNLFILEDTAQGFGGVYKGKRTGSFGDVAATSFFPAKPLGCYGDGGAIFTDNDELAEKILSLRVHGQGTSRYDNVRIGMNGRMDTLQAAVVIPKLEIFPDELEKRDVIAHKYMDKLKDYYRIPVIPQECTSAWAQFTLVAKDEAHRDKIVKEMKAQDIPIMVYYPLPLHLQTAYKELGYQWGDLPVCEEFSKKVFSIPMHPYLTDEEITLITDALIKLA